MWLTPFLVFLLTISPSSVASSFIFPEYKLPALTQEIQEALIIAADTASGASIAAPAITRNFFVKLWHDGNFTYDHDNDDGTVQQGII